MRHIFTAPDRWVLFYRFAVAVKSLWKKAVFKFHFLFAWQAKQSLLFSQADLRIMSAIVPDKWNAAA